MTESTSGARAAPADPDPDDEEAAEILAALADEFAQRYRAGERPSVEEYAQDHPPQAAHIREYFPAILAKEDAGPLHAAAESVGKVVGGRYKLLERLGEGGFGIVFMAEQQFPVRRKVALKLGLDTKQVIARFEAERQALAMMEHANIARVLDAGATDAAARSS